jgi:hypothetical protein
VEGVRLHGACSGYDFGRMSDETSICMGKPEVLGVDPEASGLLDVSVPLEPRPDQYWVEIFNAGPPGVSFSVSMHPPRLSGSTVRLRPPDREVEKYLLSLQERIEGTNAEYARSVEPELRRQQEAQEADAAERQRRVEEAQRRLDELSGG